ncbi:MAG: recombinase family protein [Gammaproteobacteria bacterium]|nr:recombinase family protein [Gammaproteobacteria bacterium]MDH5323207.1 recombinase family protein [Gammaproteobacteria bacterium]
MRAAIYARFSTDLQDPTSIIGQIANCEAMAESNGWEVKKRYIDEAISGSDDTRPGYQKLLADSECGQFECIIVDETSRLTRRAGELPRLMEILAFRDQFIVDCKGFDSRQETASLLASVYGGIDSLELRKVKERTHRGLRERHKAGYSAGGKTYGYTTEPIDPEDTNSKKRYMIVDAEADIVREIFRRYAGGESPRQICDDLNARGIPSPGSTWKRSKRRCRGWLGSALVGMAASCTGILRREKYVGKVVWNRCKWKSVPGTSRRIADIRPASEWIVVQHPELRIVDDDLWNRVQSRLTDVRKKSHKANKRSRGRPSKYLLSGIMKCGACGANFIMRDSRSYMCSSHANSGPNLCRNSIRVKRTIAEQVILEKIKEKLLGHDTKRYIAEQVKRAIRELEKQPDDTARLSNRLRTIDGKLAKVADAIESVGISGTLAVRLNQLEAERTETEKALKRVPAQVSYHPKMAKLIMERVQELAESIESIGSNPCTTLEDMEAARASLHALLGTVTLVPKDGILWAHPAPNAKGLTGVRPLQELRINSPKIGSGGRI